MTATDNSRTGTPAPRRSRHRRRRDARTLLLSLGTLAILAALALLYVAFKAPTGIPLKPYYVVDAQFRSLGTLDTGGDVTIAGNEVGQVVDLRLVHGIPTVDLQLNSGLHHLPVGTTARIRPRGLLGAEYVELVPGTARQTIPENGVIPERNTSTANQLSDVLAGLTAPARRNLQLLITGLGEGLLGRGEQLNQTLASLPSTLTNLTRGLTPLLQRTGATAGLVAGANSLMAALDPVRGDFDTGFTDGAKGLEPFAQESASIAKLLEESPSDFPSIRASLATTDTVLQHVDSFARAATKFTAYAPSALRSLTKVLVQGRQPLSDATSLLRKLQPAISPTLGLTAALHPELPELSQLFTKLDPILTTISPYGCDLQGFTNNWRGFLGNGVATQTGPLGPYTMLRIEVAGAGAEVSGTSLVPTKQNIDEGPCVGTTGGGP